jgi:hypothetical protein
MSRNRLLTGSFLATDDAGERHTIFSYQDIRLAGPRGLTGPVQTGPPAFALKFGEEVRRLAEGEYEVAASGLRLHAAKSQAPA